MILLDRVELLHWDIQQHQMLPFSKGVTIITGENGSGKTSILDAIKVGLGVPHPSAERRVEDYLLHQAKQVAMIRILVDNRRDPASGRRPFDPLGAYGQDAVTMAVVFRAVDENEYTRDYYLLDGDQVPIADRGRGPKAKPLQSAVEYRERLKRVGIGPRYLKLLRLPQGQVARLCAMSAPELFDYLFDIIGGRTVLEEWEARLKELGERQRDHDAVQTSLKKAREDLDHLARKVDRYRDFEKYSEQAAACESALPHRRKKEAAQACGELETEAKTAAETLNALKRQHTDALASANRAEEERKTFSEQEAQFKATVADTRKQHLSTVEQLAEERATVAHLTKIREAAEGVTPEDPEVLNRTMEAQRAEIAAGDARQLERDAEAIALKQQLTIINQGLVPMPEEVEAFRRVLRRAGIPHHVMAEVLEVSDPAWGEAVEGYLDRLRFAVLVQDPDMWGAAAELCRKHRYPHGVLAPDIRGISPADKESLAAVLDIKEARYRSLIARLLRRAVPEEPDVPLAPTRGGKEQVASDGFVLSRIEARHTTPSRRYLGRAALETQKNQIETKLEELSSAEREWTVERQRLQQIVADLDARLVRQKRRLEWEAKRPLYTDAQTAVATLEGIVSKLMQALDGLEAKLEVCRQEMGRSLGDFKVAEDRTRSSGEEIAKAEAEQARLTGALKLAENRVARFKLQALPELCEAGEALVAESSVEVLENMTHHLTELLSNFKADEQDPMLPLNHRRQQDETAQVETRLTQLQKELHSLREAAERAHEEYLLATRRVFRAYFAKLKEAAGKIDFFVDGRLEQRENGRFACDVKVGIGDKTPVHHDSQALSGGQKAALSILMGMTAVALEEDGAGFFLIDEPFSNSDLHKINELGRFLAQTGAQYLVSMPTTADLDQCGDWLNATWICTRCRGGIEPNGKPVLASPLKLCFAENARRD